MLSFLSIVSSAQMVPLITHSSLLLFLLQVSVLLAMALALGSIARYYRLPSVVGELCAGILLGPSLLGVLAPDLMMRLFPPAAEQFHLLDAAGQLGVILLVGLCGLELNTTLLRRNGRSALRISIAGLIIPLLCGIGVGYVLPAVLVPAGIDRSIFAFFIGVALCVSAIPVIAKILMDLNLLQHRLGQLSLTACVIDDVIGWILLSVVAALATSGRVELSNIVMTLLSIGLFVGVAFTLGRYIVRKLLRLIRLASQDEGPVVTMTVTLILFAAAITHFLHLEAVFGAFICGIVIASVEPKLAKLRLPTVLSVLAPLFFATAGLRIDLTALAQPLVLASAILVLAVAMLGKFAGAFLGGRLSKLTVQESLVVGAAMNARGIIEIIIANVGMRVGLITSEVYTIIVMVAIVTSLMAPFMLRKLMDPTQR